MEDQNALEMAPLASEDVEHRPQLPPPHESQAPLLEQTTVDGEKRPSRVTARPESQIVDRQRKKKRQGWRYVVARAAILTFVVMLLNLLLVIVPAVTSVRWLDGIAVLYEGTETAVSAWSAVIHLLISALSSVLLAGSNYTMQCLSAPTRKDLDFAHAKGRDFDIGMPSFRNVLPGGVSRYRASLWLLLLFCSFPVHFMYNAVIFTSTNINYYDVLLGSPAFLNGEPFLGDFLQWNQSFGVYATINNLVPAPASLALYDAVRYRQEYFINSSAHIADKVEIQFMPPEECIKAYGQFDNLLQPIYQGEYAALLLVTSEYTSNQSFISWYQGGNALWLDTGLWGEQNINGSILHPVDYYLDQVKQQGGWFLYVFDDLVKTDYCLAMKTPNWHKLQLCLPPLVVVIACNLATASIIAYVAYWQKLTPLVTIGDAISSFLQDPVERCQVTEPRPRKSSGRAASWKRHLDRACWFQATTKSTWIVTLGFFLSVIAASSYLLARSTNRGLFSEGFDIQQRTLFGPVYEGGKIQTGVILSALLLANCPHLVGSALYFLYNSAFTSMLLAAEWNGYYLKKKPLRVSDPHGDQRSTYFLTLPNRFSIPLIVGSTLLHFMISQSFYNLEVDFMQDVGSKAYTYSFGHQIGHGRESTDGYSPLAILITILLVVLMMLVLIGFGCRKLDKRMPIVGSNSLAIAAQCRRPVGDDEAAFLPVSWGELVDQPGVCCFTSKQVRNPEVASMYSGT